MKVIKNILIFFLFINTCYGDEEKEAESPEEKLYGVKYAQDCEGLKKNIYIFEIKNYSFFFFFYFSGSVWIIQQNYVYKIY